MRTPKEAREFFSRMGRRGAKKQSAAMTPEERQERARKAVGARWAKVRAAQAQAAEEEERRQTA